MNSPAYRIVIPARYASQRLPGKPLLSIGSKSLLQHVCERAAESAAQEVVVATDDARIIEHVNGFGGDVVMTSAEHSSGTDRIAECARQRGWDQDTLVVNLQGDEPLMPAACLDQVAQLLEADTAADMASLYWPIADASEVNNPNAVKVIVSQKGRALYFSRSAIPCARDYDSVDSAMQAGVMWLRHLGLYAYRVRTLEDFTAWPVAELEATEKLEQLRVLANGGQIAMAQACEAIPAGVDTEDDLERVRSLIK